MVFKTLGDTLGDLENKALVDTLVNTLPYIKAEKVRGTLEEVED